MFSKKFYKLGFETHPIDLMNLSYMIFEVCICLRPKTLI